MSRSLIQVANPSTQSVDANGIISLGNVIRRFGCNCKLSGDSIECAGEGYYTIDCDVLASPAAEGPVTVALYRNGVQIPGALASATASAANDNVMLPINTTVRQNCYCDSPDMITIVLLAGAGVIKNVSLRAEKV